MNQRNNFVKFLFLNFTLEIILLLFLIPGLFFLPGLILFFLLYIVFIAGILYSSYALFTKVAGSFYKIVILDLTHTLFLAPLIFTFIAGLGGARRQ